MYFRQIYPDFPNITENVSLPHQDIIQNREKKKKTVANSRLEGRRDHVFVVWCKITCRKIKKSNDQQALDGPICSGESGKKVVSGG